MKYKLASLILLLCLLLTGCREEAPVYPAIATTNFLATAATTYSGYSEPQALTSMDELLLRLLYHPEIQCGMNASQCEEVIQKLYY